MRPPTGKRYCIHVFDDRGPVFYRLSDDLLVGGIQLRVEQQEAGVTIWSASLQAKPVGAGKGRFTVAVDLGRVDGVYAGFGGKHAWRLVVTDSTGVIETKKTPSADRKVAEKMAADLIQEHWPTAQSYRLRFTAAKAHERRVDSVHVDPAWFCRPIRGRQRNGAEESWETKPTVKHETLVLKCGPCGAEFYPQVPVETYRGILRGTIRAKIPPCRRCGGRMVLEQFSLNTGSGELPRLEGM